jgi:hypothetical protein
MWRPDLKDLVPPARWPELGLRRFLMLAVIAIGLLTVVELARAQPGLAVDCRELASSLALAAWARDMKADENLVAIFYRTHQQHLGDPLARAIEREVRRLWHEKLPASVAVGAAHLRCRETLGKLGGED